MNRWDDDLTLALRIADAADEVTMSRYLAGDLHVETKPDMSPVTEADQRAEQTIRTMLSTHRPDDSILGEEFGSAGDTSRQWIIDPIDGTKNYLRGVPVWCTLLALVEAGEPVVGVASAPALGRRWWAAAGSGAHTRDVDDTVRSLTCSAVSQLSDASFSYSDELGWRERGSWPGLRALIDTCWRTRGYGDFLSHALVAEGAVDIAAEPFLAPWDMAALVPIVTESGGRMTAYDGGDAITGGCAVTTNGHLHEEVLRVLRTDVATE